MTLSNTLASIGYEAFSWCSSLTSIEFPDSLTYLGAWSFISCPLSELTIPEGITIIEGYTFASNSSITTLYLPSTLENVASSAFSGCSNLSDVYFAGTQEEAEAILIGTNNTYLSAATWHFSAVSPQSLKTLKLPSTLSTVESEAFAGVSAQRIIIPASVDVIESKAFANCSYLQMLVFEGSPYSIATDILSGCANVTVSVSEGSSAEKWANRLGLTVIYH